MCICWSRNEDFAQWMGVKRSIFRAKRIESNIGSDGYNWKRSMVGTCDRKGAHKFRYHNGAASG